MARPSPAAATGKAIHLWDVTTGRELRSFDNPGKFILRMAFSPDGIWLATRGMDEKDIRLWNVAKGEQIRQLTGPTAGVPSLAFSPDGQILTAGCDDGTVPLWDILSGEERRTLTVPKAAGGRVFSVAFSPDGRTLAAGYGEGFHMPHMVRLWESSTGSERLRFEGHRGGVGSLAFSPDGTLLASGGSDHIIMVWDVMGQRTAARPTSVPLATLWRDGRHGRQQGIEPCRCCSVGAGRILPQAASASRRHTRRRKAHSPLAGRSRRRFVRGEAKGDEVCDDSANTPSRPCGALRGKLTLEARERVQELLAEVRVSPEGLRELRAVEVLEHLGTTDAQQVLESLTKGASVAPLTRTRRVRWSD